MIPQLSDYWIMKLQPILAMFPQTASVLPDDPFNQETVHSISFSVQESIHTSNEPSNS
jgi:hypothetical protein